jgi:hypothetical protein
LGTYRYSPQAAKKLAIRELKQSAVPLLLFLFFGLVDRWFISPGSPVWERLFHGLWTIFTFIGIGGLIFGINLSLAEKVALSIWPDAFEFRNSFARVLIPRDQIREIVVGPNDATVKGFEPRKKIRVGAEIDGYAELLESLSAWAPEGVWRQAGWQGPRRWAISALAIPIYFLSTRLFLAHPQAGYVLLAGVFLISPFFLWRVREIPIMYRWVGTGGAVLTALILLYMVR